MNFNSKSTSLGELKLKNNNSFMFNSNTNPNKAFSDEIDLQDLIDNYNSEIYIDNEVLETNSYYSVESLTTLKDALETYGFELYKSIETGIPIQSSKEIDLQQFLQDYKQGIFSNTYETNLSDEEYKQKKQEELEMIKLYILQLDEAIKLAPFTEFTLTDEYKNFIETYNIENIYIDLTREDMHINFKYMSEDEKMLYSYLLKYKGKDKADEYISLLQDKINQAHGVDMANEFLNTLDVDSKGNLEENIANVLGVSNEGLSDGIDNFFNGIENVIKNNEQLTAEDYKKMIILQTLQEKSPNLEFKYQFTTSLGNMIPAIVTSAIVSFLGTPAAGSIVASILMGTSAYGNAKHQALTQGNDVVGSTLYGLLIGTSEATLGYFLGSIPGISQTAGFTLRGLLLEGAEEYSQEWIDAGLQSVILGKDVDWSQIPENAKDSFIMGILMSGFMNGGQEVVNLTIDGNSHNINIEEVLEYMAENPDLSIETTPGISELFEENINSEKADIKDYYGSDTVEVDFGIGSTAELIPINMLEQLLNDDVMLAKFNNFENNLDTFNTGSKEAYIWAIQDYYAVLIKNGYLISEDMQLRYNNILAQSTSVQSLKDIFINSDFMYEDAGQNQTISLDYLNNVLYDENTFNKMIKSLNYSPNIGIYNTTISFYKLYEQIKANGIVLDRNAQLRLDYLNKMHLTSVSHETTNYNITIEIIPGQKYTIPVKALDLILNNQTYYDYFLNYEKYEDIFNLYPKEAWINAIDEYYKNLKSNNVEIDNEMTNRYKNIINESQAIRNLYDIFQNGQIEAIIYGEKYDLPIASVDYAIFNENEYLRYCKRLNQYSNEDKYFELMDAHYIYEYIKKEQIILDKTALERLTHLNNMYLEAINQPRTILRKYATYGANQGIVREIAKWRREDTESYNKIYDVVKSYFPNMSKLNIIKLLSGMDVRGVCSYATIVNELTVYYDGREEQFKQDFGYDLYVEIDGVKYLNDAVILTDLYCLANKNNDLVIKEKKHGYSIHDDKKSIGMSYSNGKSQQILQQWLDSKSSNLTWNTNTIFMIAMAPNTQLGDMAVGRIRDQISLALAQNHTVEIDIFSVDKTPYKYTLYSTKQGVSDYVMSDFCIIENQHASGHSMMVTGITEDGDLIVSSWTNEYILKFDEIRHRNLSIYESWLN